MWRKMHFPKQSWLHFTFSRPAYTDFQFLCLWVFNLPHSRNSDLLLDITPMSLLLDPQDIWIPWASSHPIWHPCVLVLRFTILRTIFNEKIYVSVPVLDVRMESVPNKHSMGELNTHFMFNTFFSMNITVFKIIERMCYCM